MTESSLVAPVQSTRQPWRREPEPSSERISTVRACTELCSLLGS